MKQSLAVIVGTALLLSSLMLSAANVGVIGMGQPEGTPSGNQLIFVDDFDDGTLNKWTLSGWNPCGVLEVTEEVSHSDPYCLHAQSDEGTNTGPYVRKDFSSGYQKINAEIWLYLPPKAQAYDQFNLLRLASNYGSKPAQYCLGIVLNDDDYSIDIREDYFDENGAPRHIIRHWDVHQLAARTWHRINLEIDDITYRASVDGNVIIEDAMVKLNAMDSIMLGDTKGASGGWGDAYWDDVSVWEVTPCNDATATATGPQGAHHDPIITLTYDWTETPDAVDLFYSENNGDTWNFIATDYSVDGTFDWEPNANPGPKPSKYWWIANAKNGADDVGIPADGTAPEAGPFNWKTWDVCEDASNAFQPGADNWFFVSFPLDVSGDVVTVFDDAEWGDGGTTWDVIQWYDASDHTAPWKSYSIYRPDELNDMPPVDNTMGFWIHLTGSGGDAMLTIGEGVGPSSTTINLYTGWNLVGYPSYTEADAETTLLGTGADHLMVLDPQDPYRISDVPLTHVMTPGEAYWVHVPFDTVWIVDW